jgi:hypothetical protein
MDPAGVQVDWSTDTSQADWIAERLHPFAHDVGSVVPGCFDSFARILHPAYRTSASDNTKVRWAEVAAWSGRIMHPEVQFHAIANPVEAAVSPAPWNRDPLSGSLDADEAAVLLEILARHTDSSESCWFCLWDGWGWERRAVLVRKRGWSRSARRARPTKPRLVSDPVPRYVRDGPRVTLPQRNYLLYSGPISSALAFLESEQQTPSLWWPGDRSWCVASEIDFCWTYVGGTFALIEELLTDARIEALPATIADHFTRDSDEINR